MAKSLANFVVGIGADVGGFKDGIKEVNSGLNGLRSTALKAGGILTTALTAVAGIAVSTANDINDLDLKMQFTDADIQYAYDYGNAVARMGGDAKSARESLVNLQETVNALKVGDEWDKLGIELGKYGMKMDFDPATDSMITFQKRLADLTATASSAQKLQIQNVFGLSDAEMRLYEKGAVGLDAEMFSSRTRTGEIESMLEASRELRNEWGILKEHVKGFANSISQEAVPELTTLTRTLGDILSGKYAEDLREEREIRYGDKSNVEVIVETVEPIYKNTPIPHMWDSFKNALGFGDKPEKEEGPDSRLLYEQSEVPVIGEPPSPTIIIEREAPRATPVKSNVQSSTSSQSISRPIEVHANITTSVELDKRKIGEAVTEYQEEQFFIDAEGFKTTTVA